MEYHEKHIYKRIHLPRWKRLVLVATILLAGGPFAAVPCFAHSNSKGPHDTDHHFKFVQCTAGNGGRGGTAINGSSGADGGGGGDCVLLGASKGGNGGTILGSPDSKNTASGGNP